MAAVHGGVQVTYKKFLADEAPSPMDDEWAPLVRKVEHDAAGEGVEANRTATEGVVFVSSPPNLTSEPKRETLNAK